MTPFFEINSGILFCNSNSFIVAHRDGCGTHNIALVIFPITGLCCTILTALIIIYFFRNYEFIEPNLLKRRFHTSLVLQLLCRFSLTFFYYLNIGIVKEVKHIIAQTIAISFIFDTMVNWPYSDYDIARFFAGGMCVFETTIILGHLWIFDDKAMPSSEFFNSTLFYGK